MGKSRKRAKHKTRVNRPARDWLPVRLSQGQSSPKLTSFLLKRLYSKAAYRRPMAVKEYNLYRDAFGFESAFYVCPRCDITMEREYQAYCDRCGQCLNWGSLHKAKRRNLP